MLLVSQLVASLVDRPHSSFYIKYDYYRYDYYYL